MKENSHFNKIAYESINEKYDDTLDGLSAEIEKLEEEFKVKTGIPYQEIINRKNLLHEELFLLENRHETHGDLDNSNQKKIVLKNELMDIETQLTASEEVQKIATLKKKIEAISDILVMKNYMEKYPDIRLN